jgi:hypothetical protein
MPGTIDCVHYAQAIPVSGCLQARHPRSCRTRRARLRVTAFQCFLRQVGGGVLQGPGRVAGRSWPAGWAAERRCRRERRGAHGRRRAVRRAARVPGLTSEMVVDPSPDGPGTRLPSACPPPAPAARGLRIRVCPYRGAPALALNLADGCGSGSPRCGSSPRAPAHRSDPAAAARELLHILK